MNEQTTEADQFEDEDADCLPGIAPQNHNDSKRQAQDGEDERHPLSEALLPDSVGYHVLLDALAVQGLALELSEDPLSSVRDQLVVLSEEVRRRYRTGELLKGLDYCLGHRSGALLPLSLQSLRGAL